MTASQIKISKKGNAVGFDATGRTVVGQYSRNAKCWQVWQEPGVMQSSRNFPSHELAAEYAATIVDDGKTSELAWW